MLLTGSRGTGKSSLVKAMLAKYAAKGLRLIEVDKGDLVDLPDIAERVEGRRQRFVVFCDDLTFDAGEPGYKALKVMLDGSIAGGASNVVIYATSNRRHLLPEYFSENLETKHVGEEVHPGESVEEKISLSERFGLWISFYPFAQDDYLAAVARLARALRRQAGGERARGRGPHARGAAMGAAARLAQRPRRVAVREEPRGCAGAEVAPPRVSGKLVRVAAAVLLRADGQVLLAQRPPGKPYAGYWEFPGGKLEAGETPRAALARELHEELGIVVRRASPWLVQEFVYPHAHVELHFFRVFAWDGELHGHDGQAFAWQAPGRYTVAPLLPANTRILSALELPAVYGISCAADSRRGGVPRARRTRASRGGLRLVQLRDKEWPLARRLAFARRLVPLAHRHGARVLWNGTADDARAGAAAMACTGRRPRCASALRGPTACWWRRRATRSEEVARAGGSVSTSRCWVRSRRRRRIPSRRRSAGTASPPGSSTPACPSTRSAA